MKTAIVILNYNNYEDTINCIESVENFNTSDVTFFIVDNGSSRINVVQELNNYFTNNYAGDYLKLKDVDDLKDIKRINFIESSTNDGYAKGNNKALKYIFQNKYIDNILILNNDVLFVEDIIPQLEEKLSSLDNCAIVSPLLYHKDMHGIDYNCARRNHKDIDFWKIYVLLKRNFFGFEKREADSRYILKQTTFDMSIPQIEIEMPSGSCMLLKKKLFSRIGGFDPNTFLYFEENILSKKINRLNLKNYLIPSLKCIHLGGMSTAKSSSCFINTKGLESAWYYATHFTNLNKAQLLILYFAIQFNKFLLRCKDKFK